MMDLTWFFLGALSCAIVYGLYELSRKQPLKWLDWTALILGAVLILFAIAWSVGAVLEGVPRAGSMGMLLFGLPGIVITTLSLRFIVARKENMS
jgi:vacuolar-type H+-ATPase subunit I/STV1